MSIMYLASFIATSGVRLSGLLVVSLSSSVLTFHWTIVIFRRKMESNRVFLGIPGYGRSGMSICIIVHVIKAACKYVEVVLAFAGYHQQSLGGLTVVIQRQKCIQTAPNDTAYTRWSCHSGLANPVQIVSTPPAPSNGRQQ